MEGEINNLTVLWITVLASLCYCHTINKFIPKGTIRILSILPISCLFVILPLNLHSINLASTSSFLISWLTNFKILLFAFGTGPLSSNPPLPLSLFIPLACLPIKIHQPNQESKEHTASKSPKKGQKPVVNYVVKILLLLFLIKVYDYKDHLHSNLLLLLYCFHIYFILEVLLAVLAATARGVLVSAELEPQFDDPYLATSLQDFWGKRWNLMVSNILRPTVYDPVRSLSARLLGRKLAILPAVFATFFVSGLMHEFVFYSYGRQKTNWQALCFFLLHGVCLDLEIGIKKLMKGKFCLPVIISRPLTLTFVVVTSFWLFFPPFLRGDAELKACRETLAFLEFVKHGRLVSPNDFSCPFF